MTAAARQEPPHENRHADADGSGPRADADGDRPDQANPAAEDAAPEGPGDARAGSDSENAAPDGPHDPGAGSGAEDAAPDGPGDASAGSSEDRSRGEPPAGGAAHAVARPEQAGVRELIAAYPWLPIVCGLLVSALGVWCFTQLTEQVYEGGPLLRLDEHLLRVSLGLRAAPLVTALSVLTWLGDVLVVLPVSLAAGVLIGLTRHRWGPLSLLALSSAGTGLAVYLVKIIIARPRPQVVNALVVEDGFGFPSGHSAQSAALYLMLGVFGLRLLHARWAKIGVLVAGVLAIAITGVSRVLLGVHSPTDVLAGWTLGASWTLLLVSLWVFAEHAPRLITALVARKKPPATARSGNPQN